MSITPFLFSAYNLDIISTHIYKNIIDKEFDLPVEKNNRENPVITFYQIKPFGSYTRDGDVTSDL